MVNQIIETASDSSPPISQPNSLHDARAHFPLNTATIELRQLILPQDIVQRLQHTLTQIERTYAIGRSDILRQSVYAFLTRSHQLIDGPPGTGKSLLASALFCHISEQDTFSIQLTKDTMPQNLFGSLLVENFKQGEIFHNTRGTIVRAHFAFLDELFRANPALLGTLLGVLHERWFRRGQHQEPSPLHSAIATTNFVAATEELEAVLDRFPFRGKMDVIHNQLLRYKIDQANQIHGGRVQQVPLQDQIPYWQIAYLSDIACGHVPEHKITVPRSILFLKNVLVELFMAEQSKADSTKVNQVSNRTQAGPLTKVLCASALLADRTTVGLEDLAELRYVLTEIGAANGEQTAFNNALNTLLQQINRHDQNHIEQLLELLDFIDLIETHITGTEKIMGTSLTEKILLFLHLTSPQELTFKRLTQSIQKIPSISPIVKPLQESILQELEQTQNRLRLEDDYLLF